MRAFLSAALGLTLFAAACNGSSGSGTTGSSGGAGTTSGTGASTTGGLLAAGSPCTSNAACQSDVCGADGTGHCCSAACASTTAPCGATDCSNSGTCSYPGSGTSCGASSCSDGMLTSAGTCDGSGTCAAGTQNACAGHLACQDATACATTCTASTDCVSGFFCVAGTCNPQIAAGTCTENEACTSGVCGINGTGHCCMTACTNVTAPCGATDCDNTTAACTFPGTGTACGTVAESCTGSTQQNPSACDGAGNCNNTPNTTDCTPYICGASACLASCTDGTSCETGNFCDAANSTCCAGLSAGGRVAVDSKNGSDATACCGIGSNGPCRTLNQAMKLIDSAQAQNVTITATVGGAGGDWAPANEVYPIVLGWGVELSAAGVFFTDVSGAPAVFDIDFYSDNDTVGYASIASPQGQVSIGVDSLDAQSTAASAIEVKASNVLYIANATVNGSASNATTAITVNAGASLSLAENQSALVTGTVTIGNNQGNFATDGYNGIVCLSANGLGCTISDTKPSGGGSSVVIEGQEGVDIDAEDNAVITLTSSPIVGIPPNATGFTNCASKPDSVTAQAEAILLNGSASMTFSNGIVQCISGAGFVLQAADNLKSTPTLSLNSSTIQNTEYALFATAGTATVQSSTIQYNYNGVLQGTDTTNVATVDLSGGGVGTNTVVCSNSAESIFGTGGPDGTPAVSVLNTTTTNLDADNVNWDSNDNASPPPDEPDLFSCDSTLLICTCENTDQTCANAAGLDGMDAVYTSTGVITQTGAGLSNANCTVQTMGQPCGKGLPPCPPTQCCSGLSFTCVPGPICPG